MGAPFAPSPRPIVTNFNNSVIKPWPPAQDVRAVAESLMNGRGFSASDVAKLAGQMGLTLQQYIDAAKQVLTSLIAFDDNLVQSGALSGAGASGGFLAGTGTNVNPNVSLAQTIQLTMTGNSTVSASTGQSAGGSLTLIMVQDATGGHTILWDSSYIPSPLHSRYGVDPRPNTASVFNFGFRADLRPFLKSVPITGIPWP